MQFEHLPKAELHRHLELSVRHSTIWELAPQAGIELPDQQSFRERFLIEEPMQDLNSVLSKFLDTQKLLASPEIIERVSFEACEDAYLNDNICILELRYSPTFIQKDHPSLTFDAIHAAIVKGVRRAEAKYPVAVGLLCIIQRVLPVEEAEAVTDFAIENKDTFVGLDLADNEVGFDSKPFAPFFERAKSAGLGITVHCGEANVPKAPRYVMDALNYLGADRIGHGVQIYRDKNVMHSVREQQVPLELCPTSNYLTNAIDSIKTHPFRQLMENGIAVTINTDDPGIFNIDLNHEYDTLHSEHGLTEKELKACAQTAAEASFVAYDKKQKVWPETLKK